MTIDKDENVPFLKDTIPLNDDAEGSRKKAYKWLAHKELFIIATFCFILIFIALDLFNGKWWGEERLYKTQICTTPACIHASSEILYNLSPNYQSIDPCTNFDELACGGWSERHELRPDQGDAFTGTLMSENLDLILKHILQAPFSKDSNPSNFSLTDVDTPEKIDEENFKKLKIAYDACMDIGIIQKHGIKPLLKLIHEIIDLFPVTELSIHRRESLTAADENKLSETLIYLRKLGISALVSLNTVADDKNPDVVAIKLSPPEPIGLEAKDYYNDNSILQKYNHTLSQIFNNLKLEHWQNNLTSDSYWKSMKSFAPLGSLPGHLASEVVKFEKKLSKASPDASDINDVTKYYNLFSTQTADKLTPQIGLSEILRNLTPPKFTAERVIVASPDYMESLTSALRDTPKSVIQAYMIWKCIQSFVPNIEAEELKPYLRFSNELKGNDPESIPDRWRKCLNDIDDGLGWILSRLFIEKAFSERAKNLGDQIVSNIKETFIQRLESVTWMDSTVTKLAIKKVKKITQKIGYPSKSPNVLDPADLKEYYSPVNINITDFFGNALSLKRFQVARNWARLGKPVDRNSWDMTVPTVNAYYNPPGNEIVFPAGIMQFPVFNVALPKYLNYGAFGSISGHELSHAFDSTGRHYDQNGNYTNWWNNKTIANFEDRAKCFIDQYSKFTVPGLDGKQIHVNGKLTLGENIADAGGVSASFSAWKKSQAAIPDQNLPGLEFFSQDQLFFVSYANWWCGKTRQETAISRIYTDPHSPKWARILGTVANSRDFKESFNCKVKEPICELW